MDTENQGIVCLDKFEGFPYSALDDQTNDMDSYHSESPMDKLPPYTNTSTITRSQQMNITGVLQEIAPRAK